MPAIDRKPIFQAVKSLRNNTPWTQADVDVLDRAIDAATGEHTARFTSSMTKAGNPPPLYVPKFHLSDDSEAELETVHHGLRQCVELAIGLTVQDFKVMQGERSLEEQKQAVASGHSRTLKSKHLLQPDGTVWAVDLGAWVNGTISWEFNRYGAIAYAMDRAATQLGIANHIRWGCAWDRVLSDFGGNPQAYLNEAKAYAARHPGSDLLDAPHFEWVE